MKSHTKNNFSVILYNNYIVCSVFNHRPTLSLLDLLLICSMFTFSFMYTNEGDEKNLLKKHLVQIIFEVQYWLCEF